MREGVTKQGYKGHQWKEDEDGRVDVWVVNYDIHNGPECVNCGLSFCMHCFSADNIPECPNSPTSEKTTTIQKETKLETSSNN